MEQDLRHEAGGTEQLGMDTTAFWLFLALGDLIWSLKCQDFIRQPSLSPPCGCRGTQGPGSLVGLAALPMAEVLRSIPCRAPG